MRKKRLPGTVLAQPAQVVPPPPPPAGGGGPPPHGKRIFSFGKKCHADDFKNDTEQGIFIPGNKAAVTTIDGLKVGFEICFDHERGVLKDLMTSSADLDLQIICSAHIPNDKGNFAVKTGGYVLHASSKADNTKVFKKRTASEWDEIQQCAREAKAGGGVIRFYEIELPG